MLFIYTIVVVVLINWIEARIGNQNLDCCATSAVDLFWLLS
jgi:hypothetical protein